MFAGKAWSHWDHLELVREDQIKGNKYLTWWNKINERRTNLKDNEVELIWNISHEIWEWGKQQRYSNFYMLYLIPWNTVDSVIKKTGDKRYLSGNELEFSLE